MKRVFFKILAELVCIIVFTIFVSTGVGIIILFFAWTTIIPPIRKAITGLAEKKEREALTWKLENGTLIISTNSANGKMPNYRDDDDNPWFPDSKSIATAIIEDGVTHIGRGALYKCSNLISITVPNSVIDIGEYAFAKCPNLQHIYLQGENPPVIRFRTFDGVVENTCILHVPIGSKEKYVNAYHWRVFKNIEEVKDGI